MGGDGTLRTLTAQHFAPLLVACWRALGTLDVSQPSIEGVFGVEDFEHTENRCGMLEVTCTTRGQKVELTGPRMIPLVHGYHMHGPNSDASCATPSYLIKGAGKIGVGMPNLSLIRLPKPTVDLRICRLLLMQPLAIASTVGLLGLWLISPLTHSLILAVHAVAAAHAMHVAHNGLALPFTEALHWSAVVALGGFPCLRCLLKLQGYR